jgi:uncharacterized protein (DUF1501 family)
VNPARLQGRLDLLHTIDNGPKPPSSTDTQSLEHFRQMAAQLLLDERSTAAFRLEQEPDKVRAAYGDHICGQSALLARRLTEAGVPVVTIVCAAAGDLNAAEGDNWDTHFNQYPRLKSLMPPVDQASAALLTDLVDRGRLDETLIVWLTEFGRTPAMNKGGGRDHYPLCYSVAFAGGGIQGGQVYGRSDRLAAEPVDHPCGPHDLHATIFHALGIPGEGQLEDGLGRPLTLTDGRPLPLFVR